MICVLLTMALGVMACDECKPTEPRIPDKLEFSKMTVWYMERDLATYTASAIKIRGDGTVETLLFTLEGTIPTGTDTLSDDDQRRIESLFRGFWAYEITYDPANWDSSRIEYQIQLDYAGLIHRVMVWSPTENEIPNGIAMIIEEMRRVWAAAIEDAS